MALFLKTLATHPIILLFLLANLAIGFWAHRQSKANSFEDYALASRSLPTGVLVMTLLATFMSSEEFARMDRIFEAGIITAIFSFLRFCIPALFTGAFIAPQLVFFESATLGGVMKKLYGRFAQLLTGFIHFVFSLAILATQIAIVGLISKQLLKTDFAMAVLFFGGVMVLYSTLGGMRAVSYTDVFQLIMALLVFFWVTQKAMLTAGGIGQVFQQVSDQYPDKLKVLSNACLFDRLRAQLYINALSFAFTMSPPMVHRMLMVEDKSKVSKMWYASMLIYGITAVMVALIGLFGIVYQKKLGLEERGNVFVKVIQELFGGNPWILDSIMIGIIGILLSTMDSFLHTIGIIWVEDILKPVRSLLGYRKLGEDRQVKYAKIAIFFTGVFAVLVGTQVEKVGPRFIGRILLVPAFSLQAIVTIPFILGVIGLKTDRVSFLSFLGTYVSVFALQKWVIAWSTKPIHQTYDQYFLVALPLGILAYFIAHIVRNKGIVTTARGKDYTAERLRIPTWQGAIAYVKGWLLAPFRLHILASSKIVNNPTHSLSFSMLIFALYTFSSVMTGGSSDLELANFMAGVYVVGISLCVGLMLEGIWSDRLKPYFALYWFFTLFYCLSFGSTLTFLRDHKSTIAVGKWIASFMFLAFLVDSTSFITLSCLGSGLALVFWYVVVGSFPADLLGSVGLLGGFLLVALLLAVLLFEHSRERDLKERFYLKSAFSHAMTHESIQPLSEIDVLAIIHQRIMDEMLPMQNVQGEKGFWIPASKQGMMQQGNQQIGKAVQEIKHEFLRFNKLIEDEIGTLEKEKVSIRSLVESIIPTLPRRHTERVKVKVKCTKDFKASLIRPLFGNVYANFLKNAYLHGNASEMHIHIDGGGRKIHVRDNGMGIKAELLPRIFDLHFTTGGQASSGVGLALVKIIVQASGGKISCHSRYGDKDSFTEFEIEFPEV